MNIKEAVEKRRSIRKFLPKPVSNETIEEILWAANLAPTARNVQPWEFIIIKSSVTLKEIARLANPNGALIGSAAACIAIFCSDTKYYLEDGCAATTISLLYAASLGLGTCWIAGDKKDYCEKIRELLNVPLLYKLVSLIAIGYADETPTCQKRPLKDMIHKERF